VILRVAPAKIVVDAKGNTHLRSFPARHVDICARLSGRDDD
jgi:hypothetical protein